MSADVAVHGAPILIAGGGTGGHLMPALAIAAAIEAMADGLEPVLVGAMRGVEAQILPTREFRYHLLPSEPIYRRAWWKNVRWPLVAGRLLRGVDELLEGGAAGRGARHRRLRLGAGGLARGATADSRPRSRSRTPIPASPPAGSAAGCGTSTSACPRARRLLRFGTRTQVFDTGNPIVPPDAGATAPSRRKLFGLDGRHAGGPGHRRQPGCARDQPRGGRLARGAAGPARRRSSGSPGGAPTSEFARFHRPPHVQVVDFLDPMADGYAVADLVVSRAGMITVAELCAWGLPSILIPLPTAAADHQTHNARVLAEAGAALMLPQSELTPDAAGRGRSSRLLSEDGTRDADGESGAGAGKAGGGRGDSVEFIDAGPVSGRTLRTRSDTLH